MASRPWPRRVPGSGGPGPACRHSCFNGSSPGCDPWYRRATMVDWGRWPARTYWGRRPFRSGGSGMSFGTPGVCRFSTWARLSVNMCPCPTFPFTAFVSIHLVRGPFETQFILRAGKNSCLPEADFFRHVPCRPEIWSLDELIAQIFLLLPQNSPWQDFRVGKEKKKPGTDDSIPFRLIISYCGFLRKRESPVRR